MQVSRFSSLVSLASQMQLAPVYAVALPAVVDNAAAKVGMDFETFVSKCRENAELRGYLAGVCETVVKQAAR
jgi:hypothetical protein